MTVNWRKIVVGCIAFIGLLALSQFLFQTNISSTLENGAQQQRYTVLDAERLSEPLLRVYGVTGEKQEQVISPLDDEEDEEAQNGNEPEEVLHSHLFEDLDHEFEKFQSELTRSQGTPFLQFLPHPDFKLTVNIITPKSSKSLQKLLDSLLAAEYIGHQVNVNLLVDHSPERLTRSIINRFQWSHGDKHISFRLKSSGKDVSVIESWYPVDAHDYVLIISEDIVLSKYWYVWALSLIKQYRYRTQSHDNDSHIFGISLNTPRYSELSHSKISFLPDRKFKQQAWLHQVPGTWGAVYFPEHWIYYRHYVNVRKSTGKAIEVRNCDCYQWKDTWFGSFLELAYAKSWYMVYPNFYSQTSFSTNLVNLQQEKQIQFLHSKEPVPLAQVNLVPRELPDIKTLPLYTFNYKKVEVMQRFINEGIKAWNKFILSVDKTKTDAAEMERVAQE